MKKIILLLIGLTIISCSSDDEEGVGATDPFIGTWEQPDSSHPTYGGNYTYTINANGSITYGQTYINDESCPNSVASWQNTSEVQDFSNVNQKYLMLGFCQANVRSEYDYIFSDNFNRVDIGYTFLIRVQP